MENKKIDKVRMAEVESERERRRVEKTGDK